MVAADRCNSSATSHIVRHQRRRRTATTAGISSPFLLHRHRYRAISLASRLISRSFFRSLLVSHSLLLPSLSSSVFPAESLPYMVYRVRTNVALLAIYSLRYSSLTPSTSTSSALSTDSTLRLFPPGSSSQRCTTHVLTERRTSDLRESRRDPFRARHPPNGVAFRAALSTVSQTQFSPGDRPVRR